MGLAVAFVVQEDCESYKRPALFVGNSVKVVVYQKLEVLEAADD